MLLREEALEGSIPAVQRKLDASRQEDNEEGSRRSLGISTTLRDCKTAMDKYVKRGKYDRSPKKLDTIKVENSRMAPPIERGMRCQEKNEIPRKKYTEGQIRSVSISCPQPVFAMRS